MVLPLTDFMLQKYCFEVLDEKDSQKLMEASNKIIEKCAKACKTVGLGDDFQVILNAEDFICEQTPLFYFKDRLDEFLERYPNLM